MQTLTVVNCQVVSSIVYSILVIYDYIITDHMSSLEDKQLLLLGILDTQDVHGYQLNRLLQAPANPIRIGKANAYQLLGKLEQKGWVESREEREGSRPPRQVYSLTAAGRAEFGRLLKARLGEHDPSEFNDGVSLNLINQVRPKKAVALLKQRRAMVAARCESFAGFSDEIRVLYPGLDYLIRQAELERKFLTELIKRLKKS